MECKLPRVAAALAAGGVALIAAGASAPDLRVNVTGTNIKRVDSETAPIEALTREDIRKPGSQTISEVVRAITASNKTARSPTISASARLQAVPAFPCAAWAPTTRSCCPTARGSPTAVSRMTCTSRSSTSTWSRSTPSIASRS
jgi:hypothetical protein